MHLYAHRAEKVRVTIVFFQTRKSGLKAIAYTGSCIAGIRNGSIEMNEALDGFLQARQNENSGEFRKHREMIWP